MPRRHLCLLALLTALVTALLTGCGGAAENDPEPPPPPPLPEGSELLADSAAAMRTVTTTRVGVEVQGDLQGLPIRSAQGQLTREGAAKGTATVEQGGQLVETEFVIVDDTLYLRGPTGGFRELPASAAGMIYDPSIILNPDRGVAAFLEQGTAAETEAREQVGGVEAYRVRASFPGQVLGKLVPGLTQDTTGRLWIATEGSHLVQATFPATGGSVTFQFSDFDAPADITPPS